MNPMGPERGHQIEETLMFRSPGFIAVLRSENFSLALESFGMSQFDWGTYSPMGATNKARVNELVNRFSRPFVYVVVGRQTTRTRC